METSKPRSLKLNLSRTFIIGFAFFGILMLWQVYNTYCPVILTELITAQFGITDELEIQWIVGIIMAADNVLALFMLPLFGYISDKTKTKMGKRMPFIIVGTILASITLMLIPVLFAANSLVGVIIMMGLTLVFMNIYRNPAVSLMPDITPKPLRAKANGIINLVGYIGAIAAGGIALWITTKQFTSEGTMGWQIYVPFIIAAVLMIGTMIFLALKIKENKILKEVEPDMIEGEKQADLQGTLVASEVSKDAIYIKADNEALREYNARYQRTLAYYDREEDKARERGNQKKLDEISWLRYKLHKEYHDLVGLDYTIASEKKERLVYKSNGKLSPTNKFNLVMIIIAVFLWFAGFNAVETFWSSYTKYFIDFEQFSLAIIVLTIASLAAFIPAGLLSNKIGRKWVVVIGIVLVILALGTGAGLSLAEAGGGSATTFGIFYFILFGVAGIGWAFINCCSYPMVVEYADKTNVGKYTGIYYTFSMLAQSLTPIALGLLFKTTMAWQTLFFYSTILMAAALVVFLFVKGVKNKNTAKKGLEAYDSD